MIEVETFLAINKVLATGGIICMVLIAVLLTDLFTQRKFSTIIQDYGSWTMLIIVLSAISLTLVYSEVFGILPCGYCWFERVFLYPQLFIVSVGIYLKDKMMPYYVITLSIMGFLIALYHHYIQMGGGQFLPCPASGTGDCSARFLYEFGFVTFPLLAAVAFAFLFAVSLYLIKISSAQLGGSLSARD